MSTFTPPADTRVRFAAFGDSITQADSPDYSHRKIGQGSWVHWVGDDTAFAGGWALGGSQTSLIASHAKPVDADVLVLIVGTNDLGKVSFDVSAANIDRIVKKVGISRVIVGSVPPYTPNPQLAIDYNDDLRELAESRGWGFADTNAPLGDGTNYTPELTIDGVHPTVEGAKRIAEVIHSAILAP